MQSVNCFLSRAPLETKISKAWVYVGYEQAFRQSKNDAIVCNFYQLSEHHVSLDKTR
jgi:hypothetical protein